MSGVSIRKMIKRYGAMEAVSSLELEIAKGELVVLLGPSGCGKTTTLRCVAGLDDIDDGEIWIGDQLVSNSAMSLPAEKRAIGMVFQSYAIWPHMTVRQNVAFGLKMKNLPRAEADERAMAALSMVGLADYANRGSSQLSGGQQQRVALARAVAMEPQILLFDEPLSNLDARLRDRMRFELREVQQRLGITALYVTHDQQEAMAIADRIVLMRSGKIEQMGSAEDLYDRPVSLFTADFVGMVNALPATLRSVEPGVITLAGNVELACRVGNGFVPGQSVFAAIRPEHVCLSTAEIPGSLMAQIVSSVFLGNIAEHVLSIGELELRAQTSPPQPLAPGQPVWVTIDPSRVVVLTDPGPEAKGRK